MNQPLFGLVFVEVLIILNLLFGTPLRNPSVMMLDKMKQGRGPIVAKTVAGTLFIIFVSILYNIIQIQNRSVDAGTMNPTDQILFANHILEASLLGFTLLLALMIDRLHYYMKELRLLRKSLEATEKSKRGINQDLTSREDYTPTAPLNSLPKNKKGQD